MALSLLEIPLPEEDGMSDDEFDGYVDPDEQPPTDAKVGDVPESEAAGTDVPESEAADSDSPLIPDFQHSTGPSVDMSNKTPLDFFKLVVTDDMLDLIVEQTNLYAQQFMEATDLPPHSRAHGWRKEAHTLTELKKFLAMIFTMGLVNYLCLEDNWAMYWPYATPTFSEVHNFFTYHMPIYMYMHVGSIIHKLKSLS